MQKVVNGAQGTHMKEVVEGGRKEASACIGGIGVFFVWDIYLHVIVWIVKLITE